MLTSQYNFLTICLLFLSRAAPGVRGNPITGYPSCISRVFQFGQPGEPIENLAIRSTGHILFTVQGPLATVYQIDPEVGNSSLRVVANNNQLGGRKFASGITEVYDDVFAVIAGNQNQTGSFAVYTLDFRGRQTALVSETNQVDDALLLNGLTPLNAYGSLLASDSYKGIVYRIDTQSGKHSVVLDDESLKSVPGSTGIAALGVNGIRKRGNHVYFTNTSNSQLRKVLISSNGKALGPFELVADLSKVQKVLDDFTITSIGEIFLTGSDVISRVDTHGNISVVQGGPGVSSAEGGTSVQFGRGGQERVLFLSAGVAPAPYGYIAAVQGQCLSAHHS